MVLLEAPSAHIGGVAGKILGGRASSLQREHIVGCYLDPDNALTIEVVVVAISQRPQGAALLVVSNFNTDLAAPEERARDEEISTAMATEGLKYFTGYFLPWNKPWLKDRRMW